MGKHQHNREYEYVLVRLIHIRDEVTWVSIYRPIDSPVGHDFVSGPHTKSKKQLHDPPHVKLPYPANSFLRSGSILRTF